MSLFVEEGIDLISGLLAAGDGSHHEAGSVGSITTNEDVLRILRMLRFEESHGEEDEFSLDDFRLTRFDHDGTTAFRVGLPVDGLNADASDMTVFAQELERVDIPATDTAFLVG